MDVYIALTEFAQRKLIEGGLPAHKIAIKPNFCQFDPGAGTGGGGYGLFVGRLSSEKGIDTLLEAWRRLEGKVSLKIVGDGPMAAVVQRAAAEDRTIQCLGRLPIDVVYRLMGEAAFLVVPSRCYETFGRVIIEAYAKGTPVVASRQGAMTELVDDGRTGLHFTPGNSADLAEKVGRIAAKPVELKRMRQAARQKYTRNFTAESNYTALMTIYEQALGGAPPAVGSQGAGGAAVS